MKVEVDGQSKCGLEVEGTVEIGDTKPEATSCEKVTIHKIIITSLSVASKCFV